MVVFDSSVIINYLHGQKKSVDAVNAYIGKERFSITCINEYELRRGAEGEAEELLNMLLDSFNVYYMDGKSTAIAVGLYKRLKKKGLGEDDADLLIASIALANDETIVAADTDFEKIMPGSVRIVK